MGQLMSPERRHQNYGTLTKRHQETLDTDVKAGYKIKVDQNELNETRESFNGICHIILSSTRKN